jgi:hypothetical protein
MRNKAGFILCLCTALSVGISLTGCASAQHGAMLRAHSGIEKGKYAFSLKRLADAEKYTEPTPELKAEICYLKGVCYEGMGMSADAKAMFKYAVDHYPDSQYGYRAKEKLLATDTSK